MPSLNLRGALWTY